MVLRIPYMYVRKAIFYRGHNKYHLFKDGIEFIVRAHHMKTNLKVVSMGHMIVNDSIQDPNIQPTVERKTDPLVDVVPVKKGIYIDNSFSFASIYSVLFFSLLLINELWLATITMNVKVCEFKGMVKLVRNIVSFFIMVVMSQVLVIQAEKLDDTR
jgi:hypothetical protein